MALKMRRREEDLRPSEARRVEGHPNKEKSKDDNIAFVAGPSYDFWKSEGDSIYDELYGDEV